MAFRIVAITIVCLQFVVLPALGDWAGAEATGYFEPALEPPTDTDERDLQYWKYRRREQQDIRNVGVGCGLFAGFLTALSFCTSAALLARRPILHLIAVALALPVAHVLWTEPFWGFHHTQTFGLLAWFFVDYEEGRNVGPSLCTTTFALAVWIGFVVLMHVLLYRLVNWRDWLKQAGSEIDALKEDPTS